jgi:hypothetical protein
MPANYICTRLLGSDSHNKSQNYKKLKLKHERESAEFLVLFKEFILYFLFCLSSTSLEILVYISSLFPVDKNLIQGDYIHLDDSYHPVTEITTLLSNPTVGAQPAWINEEVLTNMPSFTQKTLVAPTCMND